MEVPTVELIVQRACKDDPDEVGGKDGGRDESCR